MKKFKFAAADVAIGAVVSILVLGVFYMNWADGLESKLYDFRASLRAKGKAGDKVVLIGIDDKSIAEIGRYPWPRSYMAEMIDQLSEAGAEVIGLDIFFNNAELNPGLQKVRDLSAKYKADVAQITEKSKTAKTPLSDVVTTLDQAATIWITTKSFLPHSPSPKKLCCLCFSLKGRESGKAGKRFPTM
jgi:CHASE2 domain-containing sensor protein